MSEYTPTRGELISALVAYRATQGQQTPAEVASSAPPKEIAKFLGEAERGLAEVERAAAEKAWTEGTHSAEQFYQSHIPAYGKTPLPMPVNPYRRNEGENDDE